ncbi:uncharacterized protein LOC101968941 isoform X3 [Ictidomys tridecemlineatus]
MESIFIYNIHFKIFLSAARNVDAHSLALPTAAYVHCDCWCRESSTSQTRPKEEAARCQPSRPEEESPRRQPRPEEEARPAPCASPEEVHQPLKFIKGGVATSMVLWLIQDLSRMAQTLLL